MAEFSARMVSAASADRSVIRENGVPHARSGLRRESVAGRLPRQVRRLAPQIAPTRPEGASRAVQHLTLATLARRWGLQSEAGVCLLAAVAIAVSVRADPYVTTAAVLAWGLSNYHAGSRGGRTLPSQIGTVGQSAFLSLAGLAIASLWLPALAVVGATLVVLATSVLSGLCRVSCWLLRGPVRVVLVGDGAAIAQAYGRWARSPRVHIAGVVVTEPANAVDSDAAFPASLRVPTRIGLAATRELVDQCHPDMVLASPGPGVTPTDFRRLAWALEDSGVSLGLAGMVDFVSPHRITAGAVGRATVIDVSPPRPPLPVQLAKTMADRIAGLALLVVAAPVLGVLAMAVIMDSRGPALYTHTRVGRHGRPFTLYKLRTMVQDADRRKADLVNDNEFDSVLFKMRRDPRVTRVGRFLRRTSLDELPQLLNVVKGDMSLVGPRPFLPDEVALMDSEALRRLAVRPGITGLWQVSGRSDLGWEESVQLDNYYVDNWTVWGDMLIGIRTVKAVVGGKGAY